MFSFRTMSIRRTAITFGTIRPLILTIATTVGALLAVEPGTCQGYYFVKDAVTEETSPHLATRLFRQSAFNEPPDSVSLIIPADNAVTLPNVFFAWRATTDPDGDALTYRLELAEDLGFTSGLITRGGITDTIVQLGPQDGILDGNTYYWRVIPVDEFGGSPASHETRRFPVGGDVNDDNVLGTPDVSLIMQRTVGMISSFPADTNGNGFGPDTGKRARNSSARAKGLRVLSLPETLTTTPGGAFELPVHIDNASGILGFTIQVNFDPSVFSFAEAVPGGLTEAFEAFQVNSNFAGRVILAGAGVNALAGAGDLALIRLNVRAGASSGTTALTIDTGFTSLNDGAITYTATDCLVTVAGGEGEGEGEPETLCETFDDLAVALEDFRAAFDAPDDMDVDGVPEDAVLELLRVAACEGDPADPVEEALLVAYNANRTVLAGKAGEYDGLIALLGAASQDMQDALAGIVGDLVDLELFSVSCFDGDCFAASNAIPDTEPFAGGADLDDDGTTNADEFANVQAAGGGAVEFARAAHDPTINGSDIIADPGCASSPGRDIEKVWPDIVLLLAALACTTTRTRRGQSSWIRRARMTSTNDEHE